MKTSIAAVLLPLALIFAACSALTPTPTPTPTPIPTLTAVPTASRAPTNTPLPPTETPAVAVEWNGFPIMPGAVAGDGDEESYVFTIQAAPWQVQHYYQSELGKQGWASLVEGAGGDSLVLTFTRDASLMLTVRIIARGDESLVLLVK